MSPPPAHSIARVAFNMPVRTLFDYHIPKDTLPDIIGRRVQAPLGQRQAIGVIIETAASSEVPSDTLKTLGKIFDDMPPLPTKTLELIKFCAEYYHHPIGQTAIAALPTTFRHDKTCYPPVGYRLCANPPPPPKRGKAAVIVSLLRENGILSPARLKEIVTTPTAALRKLESGGWIERLPHWEIPPPLPTAAVPTLTAAQQRAFAEIELTSGFVPHLLFGATGSGKTEIYLHAVGRILQQKKQALILTPEIHLTPELENNFRCRFPTHHLAVLHSALADGERAQRWLAARLGVADIILGTRLAVFTPMQRPGLIIVDEEHDDSYKQEDSGLPFSARNVAVWRAQNEKIPFIAGSATPSLESYLNSKHKQWRLIQLKERVLKTFPSFQMLSASDTGLYHGMSAEFLRILSAHLKDGKQALIFVNRRGYAPALVCRSCLHLCACKHCSASMTLHRQQEKLRCHRCGYAITVPSACPACGGTLMAKGIGTQRIEEALMRLFPEFRPLRLDSDSMTGKRFAAARTGIAAGEFQLLIGTQIIAKGHNFPKIGLIGILDADSGLAATDFRAEERLLALLSQIIGRGTRNPAGCHVLIQSRFPAHPFFADLQSDNVLHCWQRLLAQRKQAMMPPYAHLALLRAKSKTPARVDAFMNKVAAIARPLAADGIRVFDPVPPPIDKISNWHRRQLLVHARHRRRLHEFLDRLIPVMPAGCPWTVDVDPQTV